MALGVSNQVDLESAHPGTPEGGGTTEELQRHIARELHDQVAQPLIGLLLEIRELKAVESVTPRLTGEVARLEESVRRILRQVREMMIDLREKGELRVNLAHALKNELPIPDGHDLALRVTSRWPKKVNGWAAFNLLRIVQQAVANAWRHGRANKVDVVLDVGPTQEAVVVVIDDGVGIEDAPYGFGLSGIQERAAILGGTLTASQRESGGTRIEVRFPAGRLA